MQVPLPQEQLSAGSAGNIRSGPGVKPMEDVVTDDINRLSKAKQELAATVLKIDNDLNDAKGKRIANDYYAEAQRLTTEFTNLKGANAVGTVELNGKQVPIFEKYQADLKGIYESHLKQADNATVRSVFKDKASVTTSSAINDWTEHTFVQGSKYLKDETLKEIEASKEDAKTHFKSWNNPNGEFRKNYAIGLARIQELAEQEGWNLDPEKEINGKKVGISEQYYAKVNEYNMDILKNVVKALRESGDTEGARKFVESLNPNGESKDLNEISKDLTKIQIEEGNSKCAMSIISNNGNQNDGSFLSSADALMCLSSNYAVDNGNGGSVHDGENSNEVNTTGKTQSENINSLDQRRSTSKFYQPDSKLRLLPQHRTTHLFAIQKLGVEKADSLYTKAKSSIEIDQERFKNDQEYANEINGKIIDKYNELIIEASEKKYKPEIVKLKEQIENARNETGTGRSFQKRKTEKIAKLEAALEKAEEEDPKYVEKIANDLNIITNNIDYDYSGESTIELDEVTGLQPLPVLKAKLKATITDPKELATATKDLEIEYNKIKAGREAVYNQAFEKAKDIALAEPGGWKNLAANGIDINDFTKEDQEILKNGPPEESDIETVANLDANVDEVVNNLNVHRPKLSATQYLRLKQYAEGLKGSESKYIEATGDNTLFKDTLYKNGHTWVYDELKGDKAAQFHSIKTAWINRIDYVQTHVEGRKLNREEKKRLLNNVLIDKVRTNFGWKETPMSSISISPDKLKNTWVYVNEKQDNGKTERVKVHGSDIDKFVQSEIKAYLFRNKLPMTQRRIAEIWVKFDRPESEEQFKKNVKAATLSLSTR